MYSLRRLSDNAGDAGSMSNVVYEENGEVVVEPHSKPRIGVRMMVGSSYARTYTEQDWWSTTTIIEILDEKEDYVKFKTKHSIYEWFKK